MKTTIKLFADFNNVDKEGRIRLTTKGTRNDLETINISLRHGLEVLLDDNDSLKAIGVVEFSLEEKIWVAKIDWNEL